MCILGLCYCFTGTGKCEAKNLGLDIQKQLTKDALQIRYFSKASKITALTVCFSCNAVGLPVRNITSSKSGWVGCRRGNFTPLLVFP